MTLTTDVNKPGLAGEQRIKSSSGEKTYHMELFTKK